MSVNDKGIEVSENFTPRFNAHGLITAIAQDAKSNHILMVAYMNEEALKQTQFMIPYAEDFKVDFLMDDMTDITRKDLEKVPDMTKEDPRQKAKKEFNHPRDTVMSIIYAIIACNRYDPNKFKIIPLRRKA